MRRHSWLVDLVKGEFAEAPALHLAIGEVGAGSWTHVISDSRREAQGLREMTVFRCFE